MKRWALALTVLALSGCTSQSAFPGPAGAPKTPAGVYQNPTPTNSEWQTLRLITPVATPAPVQIDPALSTQELYDAGVTSLRGQRGAEAIAYLAEVVHRSPDDPRAAYQLGAAYELTGQLNAAKTVYQEALRHAPDNLDVKRALAALNSDFTMDGTPDRVEISGSFFYFYDGTKQDWILQYQPWQGEKNLKVEVVDAGGPVPVVLVSSPNGAGVEVYHGDGFTGYGGQSVRYDPTRRQLIVQQPAQISPDPVPSIGYMRFKLDAGGQPGADLRASPHDSNP